MKNVFVHTQNVKNFISAMTEAEKVGKDPALLMFYGQAGRGKTSAAKFFAAQNDWVYARALTGWTELWMMQDLCFELQIDPIPYRKKPAFEAAVNSLRKYPRTIVIDEADRMNRMLLDWMRDLADVTYVPIALVGEKELVPKMKSERRIWSRTLRAVEFGPISAMDILFFAKQAADLTLTAGQADLLKQAAEGDFRLVARDIRRIEDLAAVNKSGITDDMVNTAIKQGLRGK